jgi:transketolase
MDSPDPNLRHPLRKQNTNDYQKRMYNLSQNVISEVAEDLEDINTPLATLSAGEKKPAFIVRSKTHYEQ